MSMHRKNDIVGRQERFKRIVRLGVQRQFDRNLRRGVGILQLGDHLVTSVGLAAKEHFDSHFGTHVGAYCCLHPASTIDR